MHKFKVGDEVTCLLNGDGVVAHDHENQCFSLQVYFKSGGHETYTDKGYLKCGTNKPCLYPRGTKITIEEPEPVIPENTLVYDDCGHIFIYIRKEDGVHKVSDGRTDSGFDKVFVAEFNEDGTVKPFEGLGNEA